MIKGRNCCGLSPTGTVRRTGFERSIRMPVTEQSLAQARVSEGLVAYFPHRSVGGNVIFASLDVLEVRSAVFSRLRATRAVCVV